MRHHLIEDITIKSVLKFTFPTMVMMVFMSVYQMVDAIFVSNFVGEAALSALNIVYPAISVVIAVAVMLGTGGNAIIAKNLGEGMMEKANQRFTLVTAVGILTGVLFLLTGVFFTENIVDMLGATEQITAYCVDYLYIIVLSAPLAILQMLFQNFFVTAGKPGLGLGVVAAGGVANILFDYLFIVALGMGVTGAAIGTALGYAIPAVCGMAYFIIHRNGLHFVRPVWEGKILLRSCLNGSSEMVTNLANAVTTFLFNIMMLKYLAEDGVAAITIILYIQFFMTAIYMGYSMGIAPVISFHYGRQNQTALSKLFRISLGFTGVSSMAAYALSLAGKEAFIRIFVQRDSAVFQIADNGWNLYAFSFLIAGFNIFASALFTAFSDGVVSAVISFLRTFALLSACILILPLFWGVAGIWLSVPAAELCTLAVSVTFFIVMRRKYHY